MSDKVTKEEVDEMKAWLDAGVLFGGEYVSPSEARSRKIYSRIRSLILASDAPRPTMAIPINEKWMIEQFDHIHSILCPDQSGTWQDRVRQVVSAVDAPRPTMPRITMKEIERLLIGLVSVYETTGDVPNKRILINSERVARWFRSKGFIVEEKGHEKNS